MARLIRDIDRSQLVWDITQRCKRLGIVGVNVGFLKRFNYLQLYNIRSWRVDEYFVKALGLTWPLLKPKPAPRTGDTMDLAF